MNLENDKRFYIGTKVDGTKEVVWNWPHNIHAKIYPEYRSWDGPFSTREEAESKLPKDRW